MQAHRAPPMPPSGGELRHRAAPQLPAAPVTWRPPPQQPAAAAHHHPPPNGSPPLHLFYGQQDYGPLPEQGYVAVPQGFAYQPGLAPPPRPQHRQRRSPPRRSSRSPPHRSRSPPARRGGGARSPRRRDYSDRGQPQHHRGRWAAERPRQDAFEAGRWEWVAPPNGAPSGVPNPNGVVSAPPQLQHHPQQQHLNGQMAHAQAQPPEPSRRPESARAVPSPPKGSPSRRPESARNAPPPLPLDANGYVIAHDANGGASPPPPTSPSQPPSPRSEDRRWHNSSPRPTVRGHGYHAPVRGLYGTALLTGRLPSRSGKKEGEAPRSPNRKDGDALLADAESVLNEAVLTSARVREEAKASVADGEEKIVQIFKVMDQRMQAKACLLGASKAIVKLVRASSGLEDAALASQRAMAQLAALLAAERESAIDTLTREMGEMDGDVLGDDDDVRSTSSSIDRVRWAPPVDTPQVSIAQLLAELTTLRAQHSESQSELGQLRVRNAHRAACVAMLKRELRRCEGSLALMEDQQCAAKLDHARLQSELRSERSAHSAESQLCADLRKEAARLREDVSDAAKTNAAAHMALKIKRAQAERIGAERGASEASLRGDISHRDACMSMLSRELRRCEGTVAELEDGMEGARLEIARLSSELRLERAGHSSESALCADFRLETARLREDASDAAKANAAIGAELTMRRVQVERLLLELNLGETEWHATEDELAASLEAEVRRGAVREREHASALEKEINRASQREQLQQQQHAVRLQEERAQFATREKELEMSLQEHGKRAAAAEKRQKQLNAELSRQLEAETTAKHAAEDTAAAQATELRAVKARCLALEANDQRSQERAATLAQQVGTEAAAKRQIENTLLDKVKELRASQVQVKGLEERKRELNVELNSLSRKLRQYEARKYAEE